MRRALAVVVQPILAAAIIVTDNRAAVIERNLFLVELDLRFDAVAFVLVALLLLTGGGLRPALWHCAALLTLLRFARLLFLTGISDIDRAIRASARLLRATLLLLLLFVAANNVDAVSAIAAIAKVGHLLAVLRIVQTAFARLHVIGATTPVCAKPDRMRSRAADIEHHR